MPNVFSLRDLVSRPDNMDEAIPHTWSKLLDKLVLQDIISVSTHPRILNVVPN